MPTLKYLDPITGTYKPVSGSPGPAPPPPLPSGVWGSAPLDMFGPAARSLDGRDVYVDSAGKLRARPDVIYGPDVNKLASEGLETYPLGVSVTSITGALAAANGWPEGSSCTIVTVRRVENSVNLVGFQIWSRSSSATPELRFRTWSSNVWTPWMWVGGNDTGWVNGGATGTLFAANATNFTLTASMARRIGNEVSLYLAGTMKVASAVVASGNITNISLGTLVAPWLPASQLQFGMSSAATGRVVAAIVNGANGDVSISAIAGTDALAIGETVTLTGRYLMD